MCLNGLSYNEKLIQATGILNMHLQAFEKKIQRPEDTTHPTIKLTQKEVDYITFSIHLPPFLCCFWPTSYCFCPLFSLSWLFLGILHLFCVVLYLFCGCFTTILWCFLTIFWLFWGIMPLFYDTVCNHFLWFLAISSHFALVSCHS